MKKQQPTRISEHLRSNLTEEEHFGFILRANKNGIIEEFADSADEPFYLRSCAKPLQASVIVDYDLNLTDEEIALACGSNAGEECHHKIALGFAKKFGIEEADLKCGIHPPLAKSNQNVIPSAFYNNCVGKHLAMLALCKKLGYPTENYDKLEHPVQKIICERVRKLCKVTTDYPITKDGCGVPILSMPLQNMILGFLNMFCDPHYAKLKNAILSHPYIFGGEDRTDTKIIQESGLICKVGAGGLCIVINCEKGEGFVVKVSDCDMKVREIVVRDYINHLGWAKLKNDKSIKTLHGEIIGEIKTLW